jgi:hypothetical protein
MLAIWRLRELGAIGGCYSAKISGETRGLEESTVF